MVLEPLILFIASIVSYVAPDAKQQSTTRNEKPAAHSNAPVHHQQTTQATFRCGGGWDGN
jgi:hypothetical protein